MVEILLYLMILRMNDKVPEALKILRGQVPGNIAHLYLYIYDLIHLCNDRKNKTIFYNQELLMTLQLLSVKLAKRNRKRFIDTWRCFGDRTASRG